MWMLVIKENNIKHAQAMGAGRHFSKNKRNNHPKEPQWKPPPPLQTMPDSQFPWFQLQSLLGF